MPRKQARYGQSAVYNSTPPTLTDGDDSALNVNSSGALLIASGGSGTTADQVQGTATDNAAAVGNPVLIGGQYNSSAPTYDNGDAAKLQQDVNGNLKVREQYAAAGEDNTNGVIAQAVKPVASSSYSGTPFKAFADDVDIAVKASAGNVLSVTASNINAAVRYLQVFNKATAPANPDVPVFSVPIPAGSSTVPASVTLGRDFFGANGHHLATGIAIGVSTTAATFTAATTTDHMINGAYV